MRDYFCGWYFKCQSSDKTVALIPAYHKNKNAAACSLQIITNDGAWNAVYPIESYREDKDRFEIKIGKSRFSESGVYLDIKESDITASGKLRFDKLTPIKSDIMGPFRFVPFMQCRHSIRSMRHTVNGELLINGEKYIFDNASGYIEGDRGYSFPSVYTWTHCFYEEISLMLSAADIPLCGFHFTGVICAIIYRGKEYRLATYNGAKAVKISDGNIVIKQGDMTFSASLIEKHPHPLKAPESGAMTRVIRESASCRAAYKLEKGSETLFSFESDKSSFEYEYGV